MTPLTGRAGGAVAAFAAVAALTAEVVALVVRPLDGSSPLGPVLPPVLVVAGTAVVLGLRLRRGNGGTLAIAGAVAAVALAYGGTPVLAPAVASWVGALVAVALRVQHAAGGRGDRQRLTPPGGATGAPPRVVAPPVVVTVALALVVVLLLQLLDGGGGGGGGGGSDAGAQRGPGDRGGEPRRSTNMYAIGSLDLAARGELSDRPLLDVPAASPQLWRSGTLSQYTGRRWEDDDPPLVPVALGEAEFGPGTPALFGLQRFDDGPRDAVGADAPTTTSDVRPIGSTWVVWPVAAPGRLRAVEASAQVAVVQAGRRALLLAAAAPLSMTAPGPDDEVVDEDEVDPADQGLGVAIDFDLLEVPPVDAYRVRWVPRPDVSDVGLRAVPGTAGGLDEGLWTSLPVEVPQRVRDLAVRLTRDAGDRLEAARAVEAYVRGVAEYTLDAPPLPDGADAADDLLFGSRQGYCEQFATAEAVLLRAVGIPARIATGWAGGEVRGDRRVLRAKDAHAWVEVLVPGLGWVSSDPTAGTRTATTPQDRLLSLLRDPRFWLALGVVLLAVLLAVVVRRRRRRRPAAAPGPRTPAERLLVAYELSQRALEPAGIARGPTQTLADHAAAVVALLEVAGGPPPAHEVDAALADVARLLYGSVPPDDAAADRGARALSALAAAVPRLVDDAMAAVSTPAE